VVWSILALALFAALAAAAFIAVSLQVPADSPLARMYRTEAALRALATAVETYADDEGALPPSGPKGLRLAMDHLSRTVAYLPEEGTPVDAWGRPFAYTHIEAEPGWTVRSRGADPHDPADDIATGREGRPWRPVYAERQARYVAEDTP
jgi:hypothetical protein